MSHNAPTATIDGNGLVTASHTQSTGYVTGGIKTGTLQLTTKKAATINPTTTAQTAVYAGTYCTGNITVAAIPTTTQATPSINVSEGGLITASVNQTAGYVTGGIKSATQQMSTQGAATFNPTSDIRKIISKGTYCTGDIQIGANTGVKMEIGTFYPTNSYRLYVSGLDVTSNNFVVFPAENESLEVAEFTKIWEDYNPAFVAYVDGMYYTAFPQIGDSTSTWSYAEMSWTAKDDLTSVMDDRSISSDIDLYFNVEDVGITSFNTSTEWMYIVWE